MHDEALNDGGGRMSNKRQHTNSSGKEETAYVRQQKATKAYLCVFTDTDDVNEAQAARAERPYKKQTKRGKTQRP
jgi:hypothetical protein